MKKIIFIILLSVNVNAASLDAVAERMATQICGNPHEQEVKMDVVHDRVIEGARLAQWVNRCNNIIQSCVLGFSKNGSFFYKNPWEAKGWCKSFYRLNDDDCVGGVTEKLNTFFRENREFIKNQKDSETRIPLNKICDPNKPLPPRSYGDGSTS